MKRTVWRLAIPCLALTSFFSHNVLSFQTGDGVLSSRPPLSLNESMPDANIGPMAQGQAKQAEKTTPLMPLASLEGKWVAKGDGFSTILSYEWALPGVLLRSRNELRNEAGQVFRRYEGYYAWDPALTKIVFWTVGSDGELHRGEAEWRDGQLWHDATVSGGKITGYRSVLTVVGKELHYRAKYERSAPEKDVIASTPIIYHQN